MVTDLENSKIDLFLKKNLTLIHRQKICMAPIMTNDRILDASKHSQQNPSKSKTAVWTGRKKRCKMTFFVNFDLFFGISLILLPNFTDFFATTNICTYFKFIPIDIFMKTFFTDYISSCELWAKNPT